MKKKKEGTLYKVWRWSWIVTLPVSIVFSLWFYGTVHTFYKNKIWYKPRMPITLFSVGLMEGQYMWNGFLDAVLPPTFTNKEKLASVQLFVKETDLKKLNANLPYSGRKYVKAKLFYPDGKLRNVKIKYRGDYSYHWFGKKKSIRIKTSKKQLYMGMRRINLITPKTTYIFTNYLSYKLAKRIGLLAPEPRLVEVYINGKYMGVELMVEQLGELFMRKNGRMPGDLYVGEIVGNDGFPGAGKDVFLNPHFWKKASVNNHNPENEMKALERLLELVFKGSAEELLEILNLNAWAKFAAYITIIRSVHYDSTHNWRIYFDPAMGKFEPVVWDPVGWWFRDFVKFISKQPNSMDVISNILLEKLHQNHRFLSAKHSIVEKFFMEGGKKYLMDILDDTEKIEASLEYDRNLHFESAYITSPAKVIESMKDFRGKVGESLNEVEKAYLDTPPEIYFSQDEHTGEIHINLHGFTPVKRLEIEYGSGADKATKTEIFSVRNGGKSVHDLTRVMQKNGSVISLPVTLIAKRKMDMPYKKVPILLRNASIKPASYLVRVSGMERIPVKEIRAFYANSRKLSVPRMDKLPLYDLDGNFDTVPLEKERKDIVWSGERLIDGVVEVEDNLTIMPGSSIRFTPGSSLIITGRLNAVGTEQAPVTFVPDSADGGPWGAVVLAGEGADSSVLEQCNFRGGSGIRHNLIEYSAMLSIHGVDNVRISNCELRENKIVDDMFHAVYSNIIIKDSKFENAFSDAVDFDYVKGEVRNSTFTYSGNDALDLMSSSVAVLNSKMAYARDKGISVGEKTSLFVWNSEITRNHIGVQVKDSSQAILYNVDLNENLKAIDAYMKNWHYMGGGDVRIYKSKITGAKPLITADKKSYVSVFDSFLEGGTDNVKNRIKLDSSVDSKKGSSASVGSDAGLTKEELGEFFGPFLDLVNPAIRGILPDET